MRKSAPRQGTTAIRTGRFAAATGALALIGSAGEGFAAPNKAELPTVEVTTSKPASSATKKKKGSPAPAPAQAPAPAPSESVPQDEASDSAPAIGGTGAVDGYRATRSTTATKTDTPLRDVPQSVTVIPKELAKDQGSSDVRKALQYVPGIVVGQGEGHRDAPTIRGVATTADFYLDGVRDDVQYFRDLYNIDRVEVLKGSNAMIFGRGGGGGVINRVTKKAEGERIYEVTTTVGSFDTKRVEFDAGEAISADAAFRINGVYDNSGSYRDGVDGRRFGINPKLAFRIDDATRVHLSYEYFDDDRTVDRGIPSRRGKPVPTDPSTFFGNPDESYMTLEAHSASGIVEHTFGNGAKIKNQTQFGSYDKFYQNVFPNSAVNAAGQVQIGAYNALTQRDSIFNQTDLTFKVAMGPLIRHTFLVGTEFGHQETTSVRSPNAGTPNVCTVTLSSPQCSYVFNQPTGNRNFTELGVSSVYVQDQMEITKYVQVIGGLRFDRFDLDFTNRTTGLSLGRVDEVWSPRVGVVVKPVEELSLYASYSKSFLPSTGEQFTALTVANANYRPEEFENREIGFKWDVAPRLSFAGALFQLDRANQLVTTGPSTGTQVGLSRTEGAELTLTGNITDTWDVVAGYGYQVAKVEEGDNVGKEIALVPQHTFSLWNKYRFLPQWSAGLGVVSRSEMYALLDNSVTLPGYARLDAALFWDINETLKAQLNVENILDTDYYASAHNNNNITPGSPRAFYLTVTSGF